MTISDYFMSDLNSLPGIYTFKFKQSSLAVKFKNWLVESCIHGLPGSIASKICGAHGSAGFGACILFSERAQ